MLSGQGVLTKRGHTISMWPLLRDSVPLQVRLNSSRRFLVDISVETRS